MNLVEEKERQVEAELEQLSSVVNTLEEKVQTDQLRVTRLREQFRKPETWLMAGGLVVTGLLLKRVFFSSKLSRRRFRF